VSQEQTRIAGRHFLQIPGPTPVPERILRAMSRQIVDHRGPEFQRLGRRVLKGIRPIFGTVGPVVIFPASGTGAWEAALVNALSPGDRVLMYETGHFAGLWARMASRLGLQPEIVGSDWRAGADVEAIGARLAADAGQTIKAVCVVHNETSTGCVTDVAAVRRAIDAARHPALLMVDTISSLASIAYAHDAWGVDVTIAGSQKGLMMPPGLSFNAISERALAASKASRYPRLYWSWAEMLGPNADGFFPYTPATSLLYGLAEAITMLEEEGLERVFSRHLRHAAAVRAAVAAWGLEVLCRKPEAFSSSLTAVLLPGDADAVRAAALRRYDISLGAGLGLLAGKVFRIGHLGDTNDLTILGALSGVEMALADTGIAFKTNGVEAAIAVLRRFS
jgi:alanine-glyoxylate transaminase/serine-glyoxylate transaminase/serine-pyruvate transaminase